MNSRDDAVGWVAEGGADRKSNWRRGALLGLGVGVLLFFVELSSGKSQHSYNRVMDELTDLSVAKDIVQCIFTGGLICHLGVGRDYAKSITIGCVIGLIASLIGFEPEEMVWGTFGGGFVGTLCCYYERNGR